MTRVSRFLNQKSKIIRNAVNGHVTTTGIDYVQENFLGQGKQDNESAIEQAKDEQISDFIRGQYKGQTGKDFPIADK